MRAPFCASSSILCLCSLLLVACSGSSTNSTPLADQPAITDSFPAGSDPLPEVLVKLQSETDLLAPVPEVQFTRTMADTGIQISYTDLSLLLRAPGEIIEDQWVHMQSCLGQAGVAPLVLVTHERVMPFTENDNVVRNEVLTATEILSTPIATSSSLHGDVIQVSINDFDGSLGTSLFNLRSIMGRMLWLANGLPVRDYPRECATQAI